MQYCIGCHSLKHLRYSRIAQDLKLSDEEVKNRLMLPGAKPQESLKGAMDDADSRAWFGTEAPDLSLIARVRGDDWLFNYLKGFYADPLRSSGTNNLVYHEVAMPNVLWELQGVQVPIYKHVDGIEVIQSLVLEAPGKMNPKEFDQFVTELVAFLIYAGEPSQFQRLLLGKYVIFALILLAILFFRLKKEYWKDIH
jgi:ubiquinol-cytochrome c reductase cytochrome c1 subunit